MLICLSQLGIFQNNKEVEITIREWSQIQEHHSWSEGMFTYLEMRKLHQGTRRIMLENNEKPAEFIGENLML